MDGRTALNFASGMRSCRSRRKDAVPCSMPQLEGVEGDGGHASDYLYAANRKWRFPSWRRMEIQSAKLSPLSLDGTKTIT